MTDQAFRQPVEIDSAEKTDSPIRNRVNEPVGCANSSAVEICPVCSENVFAHPTGTPDGGLDYAPHRTSDGSRGPGRQITTPGHEAGQNSGQTQTTTTAGILQLPSPRRGPGYFRIIAAKTQCAPREISDLQASLALLFVLQADLAHCQRLTVRPSAWMNDRHVEAFSVAGVKEHRIGAGQAAPRRQLARRRSLDAGGVAACEPVRLSQSPHKARRWRARSRSSRVQPLHLGTQ